MCKHYNSYIIILILVIITKTGAALLYNADDWYHHHHFREPPKKGFRCTTPNNEVAFCVSLFTCPILLKSLGSLQPVALDFVKKSLCHSVPEDVLVCCGTLGNYIEVCKDTQNSTTTTSMAYMETITVMAARPRPVEYITNIPQHGTVENFTEVYKDSQSNRSSTTSTTTSATKSSPTESTTNIPQRSFHNNSLLGNRKFCGFQHTDDRFYHEDATALDEFPWLVDIVFLEDEDEDPLQYLDRCNGVLINNRYVLTTEYCGTYPKSVKLGQYSTNKTVTCIGNPELQECTEPVLKIPVEEEIHRTNVSNAWHDFALLRLAKKINFSDFIRPICLPLDELEIAERSELVFSGWGAKDEKEVNKRRLKYKPTEVAECYKLDDKDLKNVTNVTPVCLVPKEKNGELACTGDESGPLLYSTKRFQWFADSLITRVYSKLTDLHLCSNELPIAGIKINMDVIEWVVNNMRP